MRVVVVLALLTPALLAGSAAAHGASVTQERDVGPYHVIFYTYDFVTENETVRLAWNVTDKATSARVHVEHPQVQVAWTDRQGVVANQSTVALQQRLDGFLFEDFRTGPQGHVRFVLPLPQGAAPFEQDIFPLSTSGGVTPGGGSKTPGFEFMALAGAAFAAALVLRRRA